MGSELRDAMDQEERRKAPRMALGIPLKVKRYRPGTSWEEIATTLDTSRRGVSFPSKRSYEKGQILDLSLPLPRSLRDFDFNEPLYRVYGLVRDVTAQIKGWKVGVMFFGKMPPRGYDKNPAARFLLPWDKPADRDSRPSPSVPARTEMPPPVAPSPAGDRRRFQRQEIFVNLTLQQQDEWGTVLQEELTVTENIGKGGARVMTSLDISKGDVILVQEMGGAFATRAEVREVGMWSGHARRLFLKFLDNQPSARLLQMR